MDAPKQEQAAPSIEQRISAAMAPPEPVEAPQEAAEPAEESRAEGAQEQEEAAPQEGAEEVAGADAEEGVEISSLADLRELLEVDEADLYNLHITASLNGKPQDVTLSELKDAYVGSREAARMRDEAKAAREEARKASEAATEQQRARLAEAAALVDTLEKAALARFQGVNWDELRASDPAEWSARRGELQEAQNQVAQVKARVQQQIQQHQQMTQTTQSEAMREHIAKEHAALVQAWPELGDDAKREAEQASLVKELTARGFSQDEINTASDHRVLLMARDAMRYRQQAQKADAAKKKVIKIGKKVVKPGARQSRADQAQDALRPLRNQLKKSGNVNDAAALISRMNRS